MHTVRTMFTGRRAHRRGCGACRDRQSAALFVCGCNTDQQVAGVPDVPSDYRMRHPITVTEADHTLATLHRRQSRHADRDATRAGARFRANLEARSHRRRVRSICRPAPSTNAQPAAALREINSILAATGVPPTAIVVRNYRGRGAHAGDRSASPIRRSRRKPVRAALWPQDIGPSFNRDYFENQPYWNFGCASQRNLAAMVENPADLVQPRAETPAYTMRRTTVMEKYRQGAAPRLRHIRTVQAGKISDFGQVMLGT